MKFASAALEFRAQIPVNGKARSGKLHRALQVQHAEFRTQFPMRLGREVKLRGRAPPSNLYVLFRAMPHRHTGVRHVRNACKNILQAGIEIGRALLAHLDLLAQLLRLRNRLTGILPGFLQLGDIFRSFIPPGLHGFGFGDGLPPLRVDLAEVLQHGSRIGAALPQHFFHSRQIVTDKTQVKHGNQLLYRKPGVQCTRRSLLTTAVRVPLAVHYNVMSPSPNGSVDLSVTFAGIELKNPIIAASGTFGYGVEFEDVVHLDKLGGFVVKGLSREADDRQSSPRLWETAAGMLNAIGLQNIGATKFLTEKLPKLQQIKNIVVIANIFGYAREDYERTIEILNDGEGIAAYELNVSCPNTAHGGMQFGSDPRSLDEVVSTAKRVARRPLIVKLSPNVTSIAQMAHIAQEAGADAVSLVNTFVAMAIDRRHPQAAHCQRHGRTLGPSHQADRVAHGLRRRAFGGHSSDRHGRHLHRRRCGRVHARRRNRRANRHRQLLGSLRHGKDCGRTSHLVAGSQRPAPGGPHRWHDPRIEESDSRLDPKILFRDERTIERVRKEEGWIRTNQNCSPRRRDSRCRQCRVEV